MSDARNHPEILDGETILKDAMRTLEPPPTSALAIPTYVLPKSKWPAKSQDIVDNLLDRMNPVEALVVVKQFESVISVILGSHRDIALEKNLVEHAITALDGNSQEVMGATVKMKSKAAQYTYDDAQLSQLEVQKAEIDGKIKARQKFLQELKEDTVLPGGEEVKKAQCIAAGATLSVTFPK